MVEKLAVASIIAILMIVFISYSLITTGYVSLGGSGVGAEELALCLKEKGVKLYYSRYCSACSTQKGMFGDAFDILEGVDCADERDVCEEAGVMYVPAWDIGGELHEGVQTFEKLAELAGC